MNDEKITIMPYTIKEDKEEKKRKIMKNTK